MADLNMNMQPIEGVPNGVVISAAGAYVTADSPAFNVIEGPASQLSFSITGPEKAGVPFSVVVSSSDSDSNPSNVTSSTLVTLTKRSGNAAAGTITGTISGTITAGTNNVTINNVVWNVMENGVELTATASGGDTLAAGNSGLFNVIEGPPDRLAFKTIASSKTAGTGFDVGVTTHDQFTNQSAVLVDTKLTLSIASGTGSMIGTVTGTIPTGSSSFTISGVTYDVAEIGVQLTATASLGFPLNSATSNTFTVAAGALSGMTIETIADQSAEVPFTVIVHSVDQFGNLVNTTTDTRATLARNTGTANLGGTVFGTILSGTNTATISGATYPTAESGVTLRATASGGDALGFFDSNMFTVNAGPANKLTVATIANKGVDLGFDVTINVLDAGNNTGATVTADTRVTLSKKSGSAATGTLGGTLFGTITNGSSSVTISGASWDVVETGVVLTATTTAGPSLTAADSNSFDVTARPPTKLGFATIANPAVNAGFSVVVEILDTNGFITTVTQNTGLTLSLQTGSGLLAGTLSGTIATGNNSFTISGVTYDKVETGVVLSVAASGGDTLTSATSNAFNVLDGIPAVMTTPANDGATLTGASFTFFWDSGTNVTQYRLWVGTTLGGTDIFNASTGLTQSAAVSGIPVDGSTVYVRLNSFINSVWESNSYQYTAFGPAPPAPILSDSSAETGGDVELAAADDQSANGDPVDVNPLISLLTTGGGLCGMGTSMATMMLALTLCGIGMRRARRSRRGRRR